MYETQKKIKESSYLSMKIIFSETVQIMHFK